MNPSLIVLMSIVYKQSHRIQITSNKFTIGRSLDNSHVLNDLAVSRFHCVLHRDENDSWSVLNKSPNGTFVNDTLLKKNESKQLINGDVLTLSPSTKYKFDAEDIDQNIITSIVNNLLETVEENCKKKSRNDNMDIINEELSCSICYELFVNATILNCSHTFCKYCIEQWRKNNNACPICREHITAQLKNSVVDSYIEKQLSKAAEDVKSHRKIVIAARAKEEAPLRQPKRPEQVIDVSSSDSLEEDDEVSSSYNDLFSFFDADYDSDDYDGLPGAYYGGYGSCYICGSRNHWANGCPDNPRPRRH